MRTQPSSSSVDSTARESRAIDFLDAIPAGLKPVRIDGYAVAAYGAPRFSVDVDRVLPLPAKRTALAWFKTSRIGSRTTFSVQHSGEEWPKLRIH